MSSSAIPSPAASTSSLSSSLVSAVAHAKTFWRFHMHIHLRETSHDSRANHGRTSSYSSALLGMVSNRAWR
eukprot:4382334-Prorocentrum_lima.AAC.1